MTEIPAEKRKRLEKRDRYRSSICSGCHYNYYNWPKPRSERGDVEVAEDYSCWHITSIKHGKCPVGPR